VYRGGVRGEIGFATYGGIRIARPAGPALPTHRLRYCQSGPVRLIQINVVPDDMRESAVGFLLQTSPNTSRIAGGFFCVAPIGHARVAAAVKRVARHHGYPRHHARPTESTTMASAIAVAFIWRLLRGALPLPCVHGLLAAMEMAWRRATGLTLVVPESRQHFRKETVPNMGC
jgi:hypothetical protein